LEVDNTAFGLHSQTDKEAESEILLYCEAKCIKIIQNLLRWPQSFSALLGPLCHSGSFTNLD
jgi:hypothetical protein